MNDGIFKNKLILVVEDDAINQLVAKHTLLRMGIKPFFASSGEKALEMLKENYYDLVLMDIQMTGMDGFDTAKEIRSQLKLDLPIIATTAFLFPGDEDRYVEAKMSGYFAKPISPEALHQTAEKFFTYEDESKSPNVLTTKGLSIDLNMVQEIALDDQALFRRMVQVFLETMPGKIQRMVESSAAENWFDLYQAAHASKSTLSIIKVNDLLAIVQVIEKYAKLNTNLDVIPTLIERVSDTYKAAEQLLSNKFELHLKHDIN